jgi:hypothetical protein
VGLFADWLVLRHARDSDAAVPAAGGLHSGL